MGRPRATFTGLPVRALICFSLVTCLVTIPVRAATKTWTGATSSSWNTAGNWSPSGVPGTSDTAEFIGNGVCTLDVAPNVAYLRMKHDTIVNADPSAYPTITVRGFYADTNSSIILGSSRFRCGGDFIMTPQAKKMDFSTPGSRLLLTGSGSYNAHYHTRPNCVVQSNGITTTYDQIGFHDTLITGDGTSTITGRWITIDDKLIDNGVHWGSPERNFYLNFGGDTLWGGTYDDIGIKMDSRYPMVMNGNISAGWLSVKRFWCSGTNPCMPCTLHTRGYDISVGKLSIEGGASPGVLMLEQGSVARVSGDVVVGEPRLDGARPGILDDGSSVDSVIIGGKLELDTSTIIDAPGTVFLFESSGGAKHTVRTRGHALSNVSVRSSSDTIQLADSLVTSGTLRLSGGVLDFNGQNLRPRRLKVSNGTPGTFMNLGGRTITVGDTATLNGGGAANRLGLSPGTPWHIDAGERLTATNAVIGHSDASTGVAGLACNNCQDAGGNTDWSFGPPTITSQPTNQSAVAGEPFRFSLEVAEERDVSFLWQRYGSGATWVDLNSTTHQFSSEASDPWVDGSRIRCRVSNGCGSVTSRVCTLSVTAACEPPRVTVDPVNRTVTEHATVSFSVSATGTELSYQWLRNGTLVSTDAARQATYTFTALFGDSGSQYRCVVNGSCGADTSAPATLGVRDTTGPHAVTELTLNALNHDRIDIKWTTPESDSSDADSVFVFYSSGGFVSYDSPGRQTAAAQAVQPVGSPSGEANAELRGLSAQTTYFVSVWLRDIRGNWRAGPADTVRTSAAGVPINPVVVRGSYVDDTHIRLRLSNFCQLASALDPFRLYAPYIGVWYRNGTRDTQPDTTHTRWVRFNLAALQSRAGCPGTTELDTVIAVPALISPDSLYYLSVSVRWENPDSLMSFVRANGDSVLMRDISPPANALTLDARYLGPRGDSARVTLGNTGSIEAKVATVRLQLSSDTLYTDTLFYEEFDAAALRSAAGGQYAVGVRSPLFDADTQTVHCRVVQVSTAGVSSPAVTDTMRVGHPLPPNPLQLTAQPLSPSMVTLSWPAVSGVDSIRVFYALEEIPIGVVDVYDTVGVAYHGGSATADTIRGLNHSTPYYFAAQVKVGADWSAVSAQSRDWTLTRTPNVGDTLSNLVVFDNVWFDSSRNAITFAWHYDGGYVPPVDSVEYGYLVRTDRGTLASPHIRDSVPRWYAAEGARDTAAVRLGESIVFDTLYWVAMWLRPVDGLAGDSVVMGSTRTPHYTWEPIVYFRTQTGDTVRAFNEHVWLWYEGTWTLGSNNVDTLIAFDGSDAPAGVTPVSTGFRAKLNLGGPSLRMGLRYDSIPSGYTERDIRVYRRTAAGQWVVYHDYHVHAGRGLLSVSRRFVPGEGIILGVDTQRPQVELVSSGTNPLSPATAVSDTLRVSDNVAGAQAWLVYGRGEDAPQSRLLSTLAGTSEQVVSAVQGAYVTTNAGVRIYVVVTDGPHRDTLNLSRQVITAEASDVGAVSKEWTPLRTTAVLDDPSVSGTIEAVTGGGYDNHQMRVFRWFDTESTDGQSRGAHEWVEYTPEKEAVFRMTPGVLQWVKTRESTPVVLGSGVTVSLRDTQVVQLREEQWTDFALPYRFGVYLGDILDATGSYGDSVHVYKWNNTDGQWVTTLVYAADLGDEQLRRRDVLLPGGARDVYSIYNPRATPVGLRVPPVCAAMSSYDVGGKQRTPSSETHDEWALRVESATDDGGALSSVVLGYVPNGERHRGWYPAGPSFSKAGVGVYEPRQRRRYGHAVARSFSGGGVNYELEFYNDGDAPVRIVYNVRGVERLADSLQVRVMDPVTGALSQGLSGLSVEVAAKSRVHRVVAVGGPGYYRNVYATVAPLANLLAYPNPFSGRVLVRFMLPENVGRVEAVLYNALGRQVWRHEQHQGLRVGQNLLQCRTRQAPGTYVLQVRAYGTDGRLLATKQQRLIKAR